MRHRLKQDGNKGPEGESAVQDNVRGKKRKRQESEWIKMSERGVEMLVSITRQ